VEVRWTTNTGLPSAVGPDGVVAIHAVGSRKRDFDTRFPGRSPGLGSVFVRVVTFGASPLGVVPEVPFDVSTGEVRLVVADEAGGSSVIMPDGIFAQAAESWLDIGTVGTDEVVPETPR